MSLDTVLEIGKVLRASKQGLKKHFKYINSCPKDTDVDTVLRLNIPVNDDITFDFTNVSLVAENKVDDLLYLTFKTSSNDSSVKYMFGDIYYALQAKIKSTGKIENKEAGYYRVKNENAHGANKKSSFQRTNKDFLDFKNYFQNKYPDKSLSKWIILKFRNEFFKHESLIEKILNNTPALKKHFSKINHTNLLDFFNEHELIDKFFIDDVLNTLSNKNKKMLLGENFEPKNASLKQKEKIKQLGSGKIFLHFDFNGKHWYDFQNEVNLITEKMLADFFEETENGYVLQKALYKTLCSGDDKNDIQFPGLIHSSKYKSKFFSKEDANNLFYAKEFSEKELLNIQGNEIKVIVLPRGENLNVDDYEEFFNKGNEKKLSIKNNQNENEIERLLDPLATNGNPKIISFDLIFSKKGKVDVDLLEISGIKKSTLRATMDRINSIRADLKEKYEFNFKPQIEFSFINLLGSAQTDNSGKVKYKANPKYQSHILKVLPQIYSQNYYQDEVLFPAFIEKVEFSVRAGNPQFKLLKYNLEFLLTIQNHQNNRYMQITNSKSYQAGLLLGSLSKGLRNKINSFEKNYVGNLTRRIGTLDDCIRFKNEIEQKNILHDLSNFTRNTSNELAAILKHMNESEYDKEQIAFGFFESYFRYESKKGFIEKLEKLLTDYASSDEEDSEFIEQLNSTLENYKITNS